MPQRNDSDEDQHVADAVHEVAVDLVADGLLLDDLVGRRVGDLGGELALGLGGEGLVDQAIRVLDGGGHADADEGLALKALGLDVLVGGDDDGLARTDLGGRHLVLRADLALGLHLDGEALGSGGLLQGLLGHVGVGDARRTARHGQEVVGGLLCHARSFLLHQNASCSSREHHISALCRSISQKRERNRKKGQVLTVWSTCRPIPAGGGFPYRRPVQNESPPSAARPGASRTKEAPAGRLADLRAPQGRRAQRAGEKDVPYCSSRRRRAS